MRENAFPAGKTRPGEFWAPLFIGSRRLFASGQIPIGKIFGGYLQVATLKSSCIVLFARLLKIHPIELTEVPLIYRLTPRKARREDFFPFFFGFRFSFSRSLAIFL